MKTIAVAAAFLAFTSALWACSCGMGSPCRVLEHGQAVFVGKVVAEDTEVGDRSAERKYQVAIAEAFRGVAAGMVQVYTARRCGFTFVIGETYLIFASNEGGKLSTSMCSRTQLLAPAMALANQFRRLLYGHTPAVLFGVVGTPANPASEDKRFEPSPNVVVTATADDGSQKVVRTDAHGVYEFNDLRPGLYNIRPSLPTGLKFKDFRRMNESRVKIAFNNACLNDLNVYADSFISGRVVNEDGNITNGQILLLPLGLTELESRVAGLHPVVLDANGSFELEVHWPGRYRLHLSWQPSEGLTRSCVLPETYELKEGQKVTGLELRICPASPAA